MENDFVYVVMGELRKPTGKDKPRPLTCEPDFAGAHQMLRYFKEQDSESHFYIESVPFDSEAKLDAE